LLFDFRFFVNLKGKNVPLTRIELMKCILFRTNQQNIFHFQYKFSRCHALSAISFYEECNC